MAGGGTNQVITLFFTLLVVAIFYHNATYFSRSSLVVPPQASAPLSPLAGDYGQAVSNSVPQTFTVATTHIPPSPPKAAQFQPNTQQASNPSFTTSSLNGYSQAVSTTSTPMESVTVTVVDTPAAPPKKITKRAQEFLPEYNPCCDTRPRGKKPGTPDGDALISREDAFLADHARRYPYPIFSGVHKCFNNAEAYTAGWLAKKSMVLNLKFQVVKYDEPYDKDYVYGYPVRWGKSVNMEAVTHNMLEPLMNKQGIGAFKTLDALDFSIEHLSLYERRLGVMSMTGELRDRTVKAIVDNLADRELKVRKAATTGPNDLTPQAKAYADKTIVLMPFYGVAVGTGHSVVSTRFKYLNLTFWSHYRVFPHIGVVVGTEEDLAFVKTCGVPWAEIVNVIGHIDMPKNMGVASGVAAAQKFRTGAWDKYDYMYWTESDQILLTRDRAVEALYELVKDGTHLVVPHRLLPFPRSEDFDPSLAHLLKTAGGNEKELKDNDEKDYHPVVSRSLNDRPMEQASCCFDPGDCTRRDHWVHFSKNDKVCMMRFGDTMGVVNGEANIFLHTWRTCKFSSPRQECPRSY